MAASERQFEHLIASRTSVARFILEAMRKDETVLIEEAPDGIQAIKVVRQHAAEWASPPTGSALWVSRRGPWSPVGPCSSRTPQRDRASPR